jgi:anti-anti-sigma regulatory factor
MADFGMARSDEGEQALFRLEGTFDRGAAWRVSEAVEAERGREVVLDFSLVRELSDLGLAVLAHVAAATGRLVRFRGLRPRELAILRFCGVTVENAAGAASAP